MLANGHGLAVADYISKKYFGEYAVSKKDSVQDSFLYNILYSDVFNEKDYLNESTLGIADLTRMQNTISNVSL